MRTVIPNARTSIALLLWLCGAVHAAGGPYPLRPIRIVVTNTAGSGADVMTRIVADRLTQALGQQIVIDNRAGASGNIGAEIVAHAAPDGYTLLMITSQQANAMRELIAYAKGKPGSINYGTPGTATASHLATELFRSMSGIEIVHVPYKGTPQALTDTMAGQLQLAVLVATAVIPSLKGGKIRALGVTSATRTQVAPDLPAIAETVPGYEWTGWYGLAAPAGTPRDIIARLNAEQRRLLKDTAFRERIGELGADPLGSTAVEYAEHIRRQIETMRRAVKVSGLRVE